MPYKDPEKKKAYNREYYKNNKKETLKRLKKYRRDNLEKLRKIEKKAHKKYSHTKKGKEANRKKVKKYYKSRRGKEVRKKIDKKYQYKRRGLGFIELNKPFENSHAHHIDRKNVMYIPEELHNSIFHNIWTGKGMDEINRRVFEWLATQESFKIN